MNVVNTPTRVEELWFEDGGLVVQAEQSLFRVSRAILAARSSVFKDMVAFTQPPDAETIDGCPVVRLLDSADDVTCFFRAIFDSSFFEPYPCKVCFEDALSITRLSHKYAVDYLLRRALVHLSHDFPTTLSEFDAISESESHGSTDFRDIVGDHDLIPPPYVAVVQLARQVNALWMLPIAFYQLASADKESIRQVLRCKMFNNHAAKLSADDVILFLTSSVLLAGLELEAASFLHSVDNHAECTGGTKCNIARLSALTLVQNSIANSAAPDPFTVCFRAYIWDDLLENCCTQCYECLDKAHDEARQPIWDKLPGICGLPSWPELEKMKADALEG
ncbi:hypothetical protein B0H12DRAFT_203245 [Mycena haematopus]|nr:hypothetical protein B0H12DRAFT_203245 [Mycena haematopus]